MKRSLLNTLLFAAATMTLSASATGCFWVTTKSEGDTLRKNVKDIDGRLSTKEQALDGQINQLKSVIEDATKVLKRNNADIGADVDQLRKDVQVATGLVTALANNVNEMRLSFDSFKRDADARISALEARLGSIESGKPTANSSPDELWKLGSVAFEAQRWSEAIDIFKRLVQSSPGHERADDAQYFRGQSLSNLKQWDDAIREYQRLFEKYPDSSLADDGLYFAALAAENLKNCAEARTYLSLLKSKFPKSNVLKLSDDADKRIKAGKGTARCTS
jgi:TolA-binding protein